MNEQSRLKILESRGVREYFSGAALQEQPDLQLVVDRYLCHARVKETPTGIIFQVPTQTHLARLKKWQAPLQKIANTRILEIEVIDKIARPRREPTAAPALQQLQVSLPLVPQESRKRVEDHERQRRFSAPHFVSCSSFELPQALLFRWARGINEGSPERIAWVHGKPGSGKSHLIKQLNDWTPLKKRLQSVTVLGFLQEWRESLECKTKTANFKQKYREDCDVLIIEDLEELVGKVGTQKEILFTLDALLSRGGYIAVSSSVCPTSLKNQLDPMLYSRLFSGTTVEMPSPDRGFKEALWRHLLETHGLQHFETDLVLQEKLLSIPVDTARKANTLLINAVARMSFKKALTAEDIRSLELTHSSKPMTMGSASLNPQDYIERVSKLCGVSPAALVGDGRRAQVTLARRFVCLALSKQLGLTNATIAHYIEKDPSSISHCLKKVEKEIEGSRHISKQWNWICSQLGISNHE